MHLNTISNPKRKDKKRVGRGIGSTLGKTCGRGHKGQTSRSGGFHKIGFEGGQMPIQRRLPKTGFTSRKQLFSTDVNLTAIAKLDDVDIDIFVLKKHGVIGKNTKYVKIYLKGVINKPIIVKGIRVTSGAKQAIENAGGKVE